jgi:hypothetical protein
MAVTDTVFVGVDENVDLRDIDNKELKRIADRLRRYAKDRYNKPIMVSFAVDQDSQTDQLVQLAVAVEEEEISPEGVDTTEE